MKKMNENIEQIIMKLNQLNTKRTSSKTHHSMSFENTLDTINPTSKDSEENKQSSNSKHESITKEHKESLTRSDFHMKDYTKENKELKETIKNTESSYRNYFRTTNTDEK